MTDPAPADEAALLHGAWFRDLPPALRRALLDAARPRSLVAGERLFARGDRADGLFAVVDGRIRIASLAASGREAILAMIDAPQWFGEIALFDGLPRTHDATAETDVRLLQVDLAPLQALLEASPQHWHAFGLLVAQRCRQAFSAIDEAALLPPLARVARRLALLASGFGTFDDRSRRIVDVPQDQLARMLSLSRQTVNQLLGELAASGAIRLARGGVEIVDLDALNRSADP